MRNCILKEFDIWLELWYSIVENFFREVEGILAFHLAVRSGDEFSWPSVVPACSWKREMSEQEEVAGKKQSLLILLVG